jgi:hypothetical protein
LIRQLRYYLHEVCAAVGIPTRIVPHQLRHTYASEMVRSGVTLPALMKLLGHSDPGMTMRYVDVASSDLQREFHLARSRPRDLTPQPKAPIISPAPAWMALLTRCFLLNTRSRCFADLCRTARGGHRYRERREGRDRQYTNGRSSYRKGDDGGGA